MPQRLLAKVSNQLLDWLLPTRCAGCNSLGSAWCEVCDANVRFVPEPRCPRCGLPLPANSACDACRTHGYAFDEARSWAIYSGNLRKALLSLKRRRNEALGAAFASKLTSLYRSLDWQVDLVVAVPLGPQRRQERGHNQAELFAEPFALQASLLYASGILVRPHDSDPQFGLPGSARWANVRGAFSVESGAVAERKVLVLDDIMTTGATLHSAAHALKRAGATRVYGLTLARALFERAGDIG